VIFGVEMIGTARQSVTTRKKDAPAVQARSQYVTLNAGALREFYEAA